MYIYYRHSDGQVMAVYSDRPSSQTFEARGFLIAEVPAEMPISRDMVATVRDGVVTETRVSENGLQPALPPEAVKARAVNALLDELIAKRAKDADAPQAIKDAAR